MTVVKAVRKSDHRGATAVIADRIRQGTGDCEMCQFNPEVQPVHLASEVLIALYACGWRVIRATTP